MICYVIVNVKEQNNFNIISYTNIMLSNLNKNKELLIQYAKYLNQNNENSNYIVIKINGKNPFDNINTFNMDYEQFEIYVKLYIKHVLGI